MKFGILERCALLTLLGVFWFIIAVSVTIPMQAGEYVYFFHLPTELIFLMLMCFLFLYFPFIYLAYEVTSNKCLPNLNKNAPDETTWHRFTKDGLYLPQTVPKGPYGVTKGVMYGNKSDIINKGDFPVRAVNGNQGIIVFDMRATNCNLKHGAAWMKIFRLFKVRTGKDAYLRAEKEGKVLNKKTEKEVAAVGKEG
jgi:hypothetical protein